MSAEEPQLRQRKHSDRKEVIGDLRADAEVQLKRFIETNGHFSLVRNFHLADAFTVMNGFCGAQSLYMSARFLVTSHPRYMWYALWLPVAGALFDYLDGKIARWRRSSSWPAEVRAGTARRRPARPGPVRGADGGAGGQGAH